MQINRRKYNCSRRGTVRLQAQYRGRTVRKVNAATKIQALRRMQVSYVAYIKLKSATIALQCCLRRMEAKKVFDEIKRAQKDMGKIKEHNEKLKMEMASLKAMLQAQASSKAGKAESDYAIAEKQKEIDVLEARIKKLESELSAEKENVKRLEDDLNVQKGNNQKLSQDLQHQKEMAPSQVPSTPRKQSRAPSGASSVATPVKVQEAEKVVGAVVVGHTITPEALAQHRAEVARLEEQLEEERRMSRMARIEVKNLRNAISDKGVADVTTSTEISDNISEFSGSEIDKSDVPVPSDVEPQMR